MSDRPFLDDGGVRRYFAVFTEGEDYWWNRFLKRGFGHCFLLVWHDPLWLVFNPTLHITQLFTLPCYEWREPASFFEAAEDAASVTIVETRIRCDAKMRTPWVWSPVTCTELVKSALGIRRFWIWTPWQLAQYLRASNG